MPRKRLENSSIAAREKSVRFAVASTELEGGIVLPETRGLLDDWAQGKLDDDELIEQTLQNFGRR